MKASPISAYDLLGERRYYQVIKERSKYFERNGQPPNFVILHKEYKGLKEVLGMKVVLLNLDKMDVPIVFFDNIKWLCYQSLL